LVFPEPTTPSPDQLFSMSHVTPKTLRGMRLGQNSDSEHSESKREIKPTDKDDKLEVVPAEGGLFQEEITHYYAPVRPDSQFI